MKKVMVGMSGGVDSSVAAMLLRDSGYEVMGVTLKLFSDEDIASAVRAVANIAEKSEAVKNDAQRHEDLKLKDENSKAESFKAERSKAEFKEEVKKDPVETSQIIWKSEDENDNDEKAASSDHASFDPSYDRHNSQPRDIPAETRQWLFQENMRLEGLRADLAKASAMLKDEAAALKESEEKLKKEKELFEKEKEEFKEEMRGWNEQIKLSKKRLSEEQGMFDKKYKVLEMGFAKLNSDKKEFESQKRAFEYKKRFLRDAEDFASFSNVGFNSSAGELLFFKGANHPLAVKKRYKELIKIYHPDNTDGDKMILQRINQEYDRIRRQMQ